MPFQQKEEKLSMNQNYINIFKQYRAGNWRDFCNISIKTGIMKRISLLFVLLFAVIISGNTSVSGMSGNYNNDSMQSDNQVTIFPNPATTGVNIQFYSENEGAAQIKVYNALGTAVFSNKYNFNAGNVLISISLESNKIKPGMYYVLIDSGLFSTTQKLIVR